MADAGSQVFVIDDASLCVAPNLVGNMLTYDEFSTEANLPTWSVTNATMTQSYLTSNLTEGFFGLRMIPTARTIQTAQLNRLVPVTPGTVYQVKAVIFRHNTDTAQIINSAARVRVDWFDASGNFYMSDNPDQFYSSQSSEEHLVITTSETRAAPAGAAYAKVGFETDSTSPLIDYWLVDCVSLTTATAEYTLTTDNSTGCVTLNIAVVHFGDPLAERVTIVRMDEDGKAASMRGYGHTWDLMVSPNSPILIEDYEAPLGSKIWYAVTWSNTDGSSRRWRLLTQTVNAPILDDADYVWFKSPGIPALNTTVMMEAPLKWSRASRSSRYDIVGRRNPIHQTGVRAGRESSLTVLVWDPADNALFDSLLDSGAPALVQAMPGYGVEGNLYVAIGDVDSEPLDPDAREPGWRWTLAVTEVDRPDGGLQGSAASTWADINTDYATWEDLFASDTWATVLLEG